MTIFKLILIADEALEASCSLDVRKTIVHSAVTGTLELRGIIDGKVYASVPDSTTLYEVPAESILSDEFIVQALSSNVTMDEGIVEDTESTLVAFNGVLYQSMPEQGIYRTLTYDVAVAAEPPTEPVV